jgi:hypothetical protein
MKATCWLAVAGLGLSSAASLPAQEFRPKGSGIPAAEVDQAIQKGLGWLKSLPPKPGVPASRADDTNELVLYTLSHGGLAPTDPVLADYLRRAVDRDPDRVYNAALGAMALGKIDRAGYQWKLAQQAQFLLDNQCQNGQWAYGSPVEPARVPGDWVAWKGSPYGAKYPPGVKPGAAKSGRRIGVMQRARVSKVGDNSNAQYAALGLRACAEADLILDPRCLQDAMRWWEGDQNPDGSWGYSRGEDDGGRATMTAGAVGSLVIYRWMLHKPWVDQPQLRKGMEWLDANVKGKLPKWHVYYLYGEERIGMLYGTDRIGSRDWYDEGAGWLIKNQAPNGAWRNAVDTCFAILFLRRATAPLPSVASVGRPVEEK